MTPDTILRVAALGAAVLFAALAVWAYTKVDDDGGCVVLILGFVAFVLVVGALGSSPIIGGQ